MKRLFFALLLLLAPAFTMAEVSSVDRGYAENIKTYEVDAHLEDNATIDVTETITYDFGNNQKHGIFRYIPTIYEGRRGNPRQHLSVKSLTIDSASSNAFEQSEETGNQVLKIGDPNKLITGVHTYTISYTLSHMISSDADGDRFRWDAIGIGWTVPMNNVVVKFTNSAKQLENQQTTRCYLGTQGASDSCEFIKDGASLLVAESELPAHTGITLDPLYRAGTFPAPSSLEIFFWETTWYYWLPLIAFIGFFILWYEKGRDPHGRGTIVPMYDPPKGITPFEASIILDDMIGKKSLPAAIISLATQGYIKIHRKDVKALFITKAEYELELLKPLPKTASPVEQKVVDLFFTSKNTVNLNDLGDDFAELNQSLHHTAYKQVTEKGYFVVSPTFSRIIFFAISVAILVFGIMMAVYMLVSPLGYLCFILPSIIGFLFAFIMPVRTKAGVLVREDLLGLKMYIGVAEIDRIKFHNAPEKSPEKFEELLPYAIIFGLEKRWAEEFKDVYKTAPDWYDGNFATFTVIGLTHDLGSFSDAAISAAVSSSTSGGSGGFSGGGGGGGGGGSW